MGTEHRSCIGFLFCVQLVLMKYIIQSVLRKFGKELRSVDAPTRSYERGLIVLKRFISPITIIDVGAAEGTPDLYRVFPMADYQYVLIEAHPVFRNVLEGFSEHNNVRFEPVFCGAENGEVVLRGYDNPYNSSVLKLLRSDGGEGELIPVRVKRLDEIVVGDDAYLLKIDVEGAELDVVRGATGMLDQCEAIVCEIALMDRYEGGASVAEKIAFLDDHGFALFDIWSGSNHNSTGRMYQADFVFVKKDAPYRHINWS